MRLAIADPPYLGRAQRWYHAEGGGRGYGVGVADHHEDAHEWDDPARHELLVRQLDYAYDGWAIAASPATFALYMQVRPDARVLIWWRENAQPSGSRVKPEWEPVLVHIPEGRRGRQSGPTVPDVLRCGVQNRTGFAGAKPHRWTRWVLDVLGYDPETDTVDDLFPGSGAVAAAVAQGVLL